jgi:hypothetical protein
MPDHAHLLLEPLIDHERNAVFSLSRILRSIKGVSAREINKQLDRTGSVWQDESFDHVVRDSENLDGKIRYILQNPVRKGLAARAREYKWTFIADDLKHTSPTQTVTGKIACPTFIPLISSNCIPVLISSCEEMLRFPTRPARAVSADIHHAFPGAGCRR